MDLNTTFLKAQISCRIVDKHKGFGFVVFDPDTNGNESTLLDSPDPLGPTITEPESCQPKFREDQSVLYLVKKFNLLSSCTAQFQIDKCHLVSDEA